MKTLINSLQENTVSRLKNPLVGAYVFSWTIWNVTDVMLFLLSNNAEKIEMVKGSRFELQNDLLFPLVISVVYLIVVPVLNMLYERIVDGVINKYRNAFKQKTLQDHYYSVKRTTIAKLDSDEEENRKLRDRQLDTWAEEKQRMSETIIQFRAEHAARMAKLDNEVSSYREEIQRLTSEVYDIGTREQSISQELRNVVRDVGMAVEQLVNVSDLPDRGFDLTKGISDATNRARKILDMPLVVHQPQYSYNEPPMDFDDDIPF
ncbi:hypothetical protein [Vibrio parahaemolyticus]|uniref:hypothetical protein n=2 Tax=Vibrio parahaemolyticus TaxID=670 RepID=UPI0005432980|nr:hypothetical protein [Vibrio parahaemolyticus]KHF16976.1 hypothetical protein PO81_21415 [Vibrio parahaemolyticus]TBT47276.1 hypothetical protein D5E75_24215 [Vibrio parahaemolyticus]